jgi:predicted HD superfamily hydrolase involved in NAD metabolism
MNDRDLRDRMSPGLPPGLIGHIDRVVVLASRLAGRNGLDAARVRLAAQGHDLLRAVPPDELLARAEARGLEIDPVERGEPVLLHGPLGAIELAERFGIADERVLQAVYWHTTGHPDFDREAWAMFVADKVEPDKVRRRPELRPVEEVAETSLEAAALAYLDQLVRDAVEQRWQLHPMANLARNALLARTGSQRG